MSGYTLEQIETAARALAQIINGPEREWREIMRDAVRLLDYTRAKDERIAALEAERDELINSISDMSIMTGQAMRRVTQSMVNAVRACAESRCEADELRRALAVRRAHSA